jgi:glycosyltransferase involved in cell wall biosynthesis
LGADVISSNFKSFDELRLLYVGTLNGRRIEDSIKGLAIFINNNSSIPIKYVIIGDGTELNSIKKLISDLQLSNIVKMYGRVPHFKLKPFFDIANVGVSYIPITEYYQHQPPTKTFEYILSGMPCIATRTYENTKLITEENGVLCDDTPESFALAMEVILKNKAQYRSDNIRDSLKEFNWENIVRNRLVPIFQNLN